MPELRLLAVLLALCVLVGGGSGPVGSSPATPTTRSGRAEVDSPEGAKVAEK